MKVSISDKPEGWQPKTLSITFETEEEYTMLMALFSYDCSIPELICPVGEARSKLCSIMMKIQEAF